jgi:hypothetical protein
MAPYVESWRQSGPFFYLPLHPKIEVLNDIAFELLRNAGLWRGAAPAAPRDRLAHHAIWPVYPEIGERIGLPGDYRFWPRTSPEDHGAERVPLGLPEFIERTFAAYGQQAPAPSSFPRLEDERLQSITSLARTVEPNATDETEIADWMDAEDEIAANIICDEELLDDGSD